MKQKINTEFLQKSQPFSNPTYQNWQEFKQNYFRYNTPFQKQDNYQQQIQIVDFFKKDFCYKNCLVQDDTQNKLDKILNYIIEYQQQYNLSHKQIYQLKRIYVDKETNKADAGANDAEKVAKDADIGTNEVGIGTKKLEIETKKGVDIGKKQACKENKEASLGKMVDKNFKNSLNQIFDSFYEGENSQIILQHISNEPNRIRLLISQAIKKFQKINAEKGKNKYDVLKLCYIAITKDYDLKADDLQVKEGNSFQNFSIMLQDEQSFSSKPIQDIKSLIQQDQYYLKLNIANKKITNEILHLYRYFLKNKIQRYQPKLIVLLLEINDSFEFEAYFFQKLIFQLEKISQNCLIIIPLLTSHTPEGFEKYLKSTLLISNSYYDYKFKRKNKTHYQCEDISAQQYKEYSKYFAQTVKEEQQFLRQYSALKVRQNNFQSLEQEQMEIEYQKQMLPTEKSTQVIEALDSNQAQELEYNLFGILNSRNQIELTKLFEKQSKQPIRIFEVEHFIYYNQDNQSFIICIVKDDKLFYQYSAYKLNQEKQIEDSIYLEEYRYFEKFEKKLKSSYLLEGEYFYQFNVSFQKETLNQIQRKKSSGFNYYVQFKKYNLRYGNKPDFYHNSENQKDGPTKDCQFILMGGTYESYVPQNQFEEQKRQSEYEFNLGAYALTVEMNEQQKNKLKVIENVGKLKCYENSLIQKINDQSFLYFEGQTKYQAGSFQSQIQRMSIFGFEQSLQFDNCKIQNQDYFDFYQKKKKLFRSNQLNKKIIEQSKKKVDFIVVVQELIYEKVKIVDEEDIVLLIEIIYSIVKLKNIGYINLKQLSKQVQLQAHKFRFTYDPAKQVQEDNKTKQILDIQEESFYFIIEQVEKSNSLRNACLYANWLEDRNNQYIFHYNGVQNLYLLYFYEKPKPKTRKFIFEDQQDKEDNLDFDEVILNDLENEQLWIVRKINHQDKIYLDLYDSDWINLQDVKDSNEDAITKVPINQIFRIAELKEDFCLIGLEVKWQGEQGQRCPYLIVCTSTTIYEISIKQIRKTKWDNILRYKLNSWEKEPLQFQQSPISRCRQVQFQVNMQIPTIVANLQNGDLLLFYSYCNVKNESQNKYLLEIKYLILKDYNQICNDEMEMEENNREYQFRTIEYNSRQQVNLAKVNTVIINDKEFEFSIIVEESDGCLYKVFSGDRQKKQYITLIRESKILSNAAFQKNESIIIDRNNETVVHLNDFKLYNQQ